MKNPPEYRRFRLAAWLVYMAVAFWFCGALYVNVFQGARGRQGIVPALAAPSAVTADTLKGCTDELGTLRTELDERLHLLVGRPDASPARDEWEQWSPGWRARLLAVAARCRLTKDDVPNVQPVRQAYEELTQLHRQYTTLITQYSKEVGPVTARVNGALDRAKKAAGAQ